MDGKERGVLFAALDQADVSAIDAHACRDLGLTDSGGLPVEAHIRAEELTDIHPQLRNQSRILVRRIIILGLFACEDDAIPERR